LAGKGQAPCYLLFSLNCTKRNIYKDSPISTFIDALLEAVRLVLSLDPEVVEIAGRSLGITAGALAISALIGTPLGTWLAFARLPGKRIFTALVYTGMGIPPVVAGLAIFLLLSRQGPMGWLGWLFSVQAMILAQVVIATPLIIGLTMSAVLAVDSDLPLQLRGLGATHFQAGLAVFREAALGWVVSLAAGFGSIISEVGAVMLVGGNIEGRTRVLTSAIVLETRQGNFDFALALGIVLLGLSFLANLVMVLLQGRISAR
jgi:tungstate transport system permease protein